MSQATQPALLNSDPEALRVVFFGPRDSGKTNLLKACLQLADPFSLPLDSVHTGELRPHRVEFGEGDEQEIFQVYDCDGRAADELLTTVSTDRLKQRHEQLVEAIRQADTLVLVVDATANVEYLKRVFFEFLTALEEARCYGREVGGLPVFLTLTKCDRLKQPGDSATTWLKRVEQQKAYFQGLFEEFRSEQAEATDWQSYLPFGALSFSVQATSMQVREQPELQHYMDEAGLFGVMELWKQVTASARVYRDRTDAGRKRLRYTVGGAGGFVAGLLAILSLLLVTGGIGGRDILAERVQLYRQQEPTVAVRLSDRQFFRYQKELQDIQANPLFDRLPSDFQEFVQSRLKEFAAYQQFRALFLPPRLGPAEVQTREQVSQLQHDLAKLMVPPEDYASTWQDTEAVRLRLKWQRDLTLLQEAEGQLHEWFRSLIRRGNQLLLIDRAPDPNWRIQVMSLFNEASNPPQKPTDDVPKSESVPVLRGKKLKFASAYHFDRVAAAERDWQTTRERLTYLRDLGDAIGLTTGPGTPSAVLDLPEPAFNSAGSQELGAAKLAALRVTFPGKVYPDDTYPQWRIDQFPDPVRRGLLVRLVNIRDTALRHVQRLMLQQLPTESHDAWRGLANGLLQEEALKAWGKLLLMLNLWLDGNSRTDPIQAAVVFFQQPAIKLSVKGLSLTISDDLLDPRATPTGKFTVKHNEKEYQFQLVGEPKRDRPLSTYTFAALGSPLEVNFTPGDSVSLEAEVRSGSELYKLIWSSSRSKWYQLDALQQPPRLEKVGPIPAPRLVMDVRLAPIPQDGWPRVPVLLPDMRTARP